jgi:hypothetical protein
MSVPQLDCRDSLLILVVRLYVVGERVPVGGCGVQRSVLVKVRLKVFSQNVACVVLACNYPNSHAVFYVVLSDCMMSCVDCSRGFVQSGLSCNMFSCLIVCVEVADVVGAVPIKV